MVLEESYRLTSPVCSAANGGAADISLLGVSFAMGLTSTGKITSVKSTEGRTINWIKMDGPVVKTTTAEQALNVDRKMVNRCGAGVCMYGWIDMWMYELCACM